MRQSRRKTRNRLARTDTRALDEPVHLHATQGEVVRERVSRGDKVRTLLDDGFAGRFVGRVDHEGEVFWSHEGGACRADQDEAVVEPLGRLGQAREVDHLSTASSANVRIEGETALTSGRGRERSPSPNNLHGDGRRAGGQDRCSAPSVGRVASNLQGRRRRATQSWGCCTPRHRLRLISTALSHSVVQFTRRISLFAVSSVEDHIEVHKVKVRERLVCARRTNGVDVGRQLLFIISRCQT